MRLAIDTYIDREPTVVIEIKCISGGQLKEGTVVRFAGD